MKNAIGIVGKVLGSMLAVAALTDFAGAQGHVLPHGGLGQVIECPGRGTLSILSGKTLEGGLRLALEIAPSRGRDALASLAAKRRMVLSGGAPGTLAAVHVARRTLYASETMPAGGLVLRGAFDVRGKFVAEIPDGLELRGFSAQGATLEDRMVSVSVDLGAAEEEAFASWTLEGEIEPPAHSISARFVFPRRYSLNR